MLNECLVDRGASPNMVTLEAYVDGHHITTVQVFPPSRYSPSSSLSPSLRLLHTEKADTAANAESKEKTTPFGVNSARSLVLYQAA